ncbi:MAG: T9SS type A sorting domain-containing protein [Lewinellaceae bacterium]|nr:T9SS type A sorting domain-containing protein [Lewinellaceae bacterium]
MKFKTVFSNASLFLLMIHWATPSVAQCSFDPTVSGNLLVCPESATMLTTQQYDSYQWYRRPYPDGAAEPIQGATGPSLSVDYLETPVYISVAATQGGCTEQSPEVLVDGLAFLPVTVQSSGEFNIGPNGEHIICAGDTVYFMIMLPYTRNIQWYDGLNEIAGATDDTLVVTQPGNYWVTASPTDCPNYMASLGLQIPVIWGSTPGCTTSVGDPADSGMDAVIMPNPARESLLVGVDIAGIVHLSLFNSLGQIVRQESFSVSTELHTSDLPVGVYTLVLQANVVRLARQVVVQR